MLFILDNYDRLPPPPPPPAIVLFIHKKIFEHLFKVWEFYKYNKVFTN